MDDLDITECDREEIHLLGKVQPFAVLLEFAEDAALLTYSRNAPQVLQIEEEALRSSHAGDLLGQEAWSLIGDVTQAISDKHQVERLFDVDGCLPDAPANLSVSLSRRGLVVEIERCEAQRKPDFLPEVRRIADALQPSMGLSAILEQGAQAVRKLTGFDRVMIYRFRPDGTGEVVAEARGEGIESFLGLRYPASDIPRQARELYRRNLLRLIADVEAQDIELESIKDRELSQPLDLSACISRAVSPVHIQYLKNMGVRASMSVSIIDMDGFWGLIACHNLTGPLLIQQPGRSAVELFGQLFAYKVSESRALNARSTMNRAQLAHSQITAHLADPRKLRENFSNVGKLIMGVIDCDGLVARIGGEFLRFGHAPDRIDAQIILDFMQDRGENKVFATDSLSSHIAEAERLADRCAGILVIPISRLPEDFLILCRRELATTVRWAGNPEKRVVKAKGNERLLPRESFAEWLETARGMSEPWTNREIQLAESLRATFVEVLYKLTDKSARETERANQRQELLINELNHRVRNILTLISSLVDQTAQGQTDIAAFKEGLEGRIASLSLAHSLMTDPHQRAASLRALASAEVTPFISSGKADQRFLFEGPDLLINHEALPMLALVLHELATNAVKYGALSNSEGRIVLSASRLENGEFDLLWEETGGPPVASLNAPSMGTTLIEEAVPFQLGGKVEIRPLSSGMRVRLTLPANVVRSTGTSEARQQEADMNAPQDTASEAHAHVLVLEDEYMIAKTQKRLLEAIGIDEVSMVSNTKDALELIAARKVDFAMLDINLGQETSEAVARQLQHDAVPFVFASGYGEAAVLAPMFEDVPRLTKPFQLAALRHVIPAALLRES